MNHKSAVYKQTIFVVNSLISILLGIQKKLEQKINVYLKINVRKIVSKYQNITQFVTLVVPLRSAAENNLSTL